MRFVAFHYPGSKTSFENGNTPDPDEVSKMLGFIEEMSSAGGLVSMEGLLSSDADFSVIEPDHSRVVTDGPFTEVKELIGGFGIWEVASRDEALAWANKCPLCEGDRLEVRQIFERDAFQEEIGDDHAESVERIGESLSSN